MGRAQPEEKAPDTVPVPTPPVESGERNPDVTVIPRTPEVDRLAEAPDAYRPKRGYVQLPTRKKKPAKRVIEPVENMLVEIEKRDGNVPPELVVLVLRSYRMLEASHRALKEVMRSHVEEIKRLKARR